MSEDLSWKAGTLTENEEKRLKQQTDPIFALFLRVSHGIGAPERKKPAKPRTDDEHEQFILRQVTKLLRQHGDTVTEPYGLKGNVIKCRQKGPRTDPEGNVHKRNNCYFKFDDKGNLRYHCHNKDCCSVGWAYGVIQLT